MSLFFKKIIRGKKLVPHDLNTLMGFKKGRRTVYDDFGMMELANTGVTKTSALNLAKQLNLSIAQISKLLPITERTFYRYTKNHKLDKYVTEQVLQIAQVAARGFQVFEDRELFLEWFNSPCIALGNEKPINFLNSRFGCNLVLQELGRIEHGVNV